MRVVAGNPAMRALRAKGECPKNVGAGAQGPPQGKKISGKRTAGIPTHQKFFLPCPSSPYAGCPLFQTRLPYVGGTKFYPAVIPKIRMTLFKNL